MDKWLGMYVCANVSRLFREGGMVIVVVVVVVVVVCLRRIGTA